MTDWMTNLERAKSLLDAGVLTQGEFDEEKARLLPRSFSDEGGSFEPEHEGERSSLLSAPWIIAGLVAICLAVGAFFVVSLFTRNGALRSSVDQANSELVKTDTASEAADPPKAQPVELAATLQFSAPSQCVAGGTLERIYLKLDKAMDEGARGLSIKLDAFPGGIPVSAESKTDRGVQESKAEVRFPGGTTWHGLRLSRITTSTYAPPDSDSSYSRSINFLEPPEKVRRALGELGFRAKLAPEYSDLADADNVCGGSMQIVALPGGSALSCSWGC